LSNNSCSSVRTADFSATEEALLKADVSKALRNLTTRSLAGCGHWQKAANA
jgi:hypothetical protein